MTTHDPTLALTVRVSAEHRPGATPVCGVLTRFEPKSCIVQLDREPTADLVLGAPVGIEVRGAEGARIAGAVRQKVGRRLFIEIRHAGNGDQRYFPRIDGGLALAYRVVDSSFGDATCRSWLRGLRVADETSWHQAPEYMNVSASGLRFEDQLDCQIGDRLLLALRIPEREGTIRATGRVVREEAGRAGVRQIAIEFVDIDPEHVEALTDYTLERQLAAMASDAG